MILDSSASAKNGMNPQQVIESRILAYRESRKFPMGLYVHIPFCVSRCRYCDFVSTAGLSRDWQEQYVQGLHSELAMYREAGTAEQAGGAAQADGNAAWETVYIGGGTPTYLDADILEKLLLPDLRALGEFTAEANPGTLTKEKLKILREAGCNRLSVGAQSFDDHYLAWLGRSHDAAGFDHAWRLAREAGFTNMNLDLLYGLPHQSAGHWERTLREALAYRPEHISLYQLNVEAGTPLALLADAGQTCTADEESCRIQYLSAHRLLTDAGYIHYEISNYALPGRESRHNTLYWENGLYLGIGAGAAGHLPGVRYTNTADLEAYLSSTRGGKMPPAQVERISPAIAREEELMLAFRLREGVGKAQFQERWGVTMDQLFGAVIRRLTAAGLLEEDKDRLRPSLEGWLQYNSWIQDFI